MKLFTRSLAALLLLVASLAPSWAVNITILVGNNYYHGPNNTNSDSDVRIITVGDVVTWTWVAGSHPTMSDSSPAAWATFPMNSASPTFTRTFNTVGIFPYHCTSHGGPNLGQYGSLDVRVATPTATLDARSAGITVNVFPNPSRGQVTVQFEQKQKLSGDYKLRLNNIIGQEIRTFALKPELTSAGLPLDLTDLRAGVYFYSLLVDGKVVTTKRLVLQN
ncbi:T9SS type A sorting domain-containing protein [Hymenobacter sp.]|uniref:T9SS type A sorting domain-containing protein n=1 Tax=Hymenobacter sp. TaxID=1898978 RepID=UPI002869EDD9|nr:T9SS type A sorting domain-containing protein [Hymenobacter sp.]